MCPVSISFVFLCFISARAESPPFQPSAPDQEKEPTAETKVVSFSNDIFPLLKDRCFECHSAVNNEGDLRLDDEQLARRGGHTGRKMFAESAEQSELFQRLIATDEELRMPKRQEPLSVAEIEKFKTWIDAGAPWEPSAARASAPTAGGASSASQQREDIFHWLGNLLLNSGFAGVEPGRAWYRASLGLCCGWFLLVILRCVIARGFRSTRQPSQTDQANNTKLDSQDRLPKWFNLFFGWQTLLLLFGATLLLAVLFYQQGRIAELGDLVLQANAKVRKQLPVKLTENRNQLVWPTHPSHPPRLGGVYYRGNDERDPSLFNGGVYRTATMELSLIDADANRLQWGDSVSGRSLFIFLTIKRAAGATHGLFSKSIFDQTRIRRFRETDLIQPAGDESIEQRFTAVDPDEEWMIKIPLESVNEWRGGRNAGIAYLFYGSEVDNGFLGRVHYGIRYDFHLTDGQIAPSSVLWMGSMYDLGGRVLVPQANEILLDHWFDYRPIPEIEGSNTEDPELLGLPEHLGNRKLK